MSRPTPARFKPKKKKIYTGLQKQPDEMLKIISTCLNPASYLALIGTCKRIRKLGDDTTFPANHARDVARILHLIYDKRKNVFITGSAGTGKTYIMNKIYAVSARNNRRAVMTATTGAASVGLTDGRTIHSFSGLRKGTIPIDKLREQLALGQFRAPRIWRETDLLLTDEVSMNGSKFMQKVNMVGKYARQSDQPLGGMQVVWSGDFSQLPPVGDKFIFTSDLWDELNFSIVYLRYPFRQTGDMNYYYFLQRIRIGEPTEKDIDFLEQKCELTALKKDELEQLEIRPTRLMSKQKDVKIINDREFNKLQTPIIHSLHAVDSIRKRVDDNGRAGYVITHEMTVAQGLAALGDRAEHQAPSILQLRDGCQLILTFNFDVKKKHVNGSRCVYREGLIHFLDGSTKTIDSCLHTFTYPINNGFYLYRSQLALRLGYAMSIHSSQGMSLDLAQINLGPSIFCSAQCYVALSRVRNSDGLWIDEFSRKSIKTNKEAKEFMKKLERLSLDSDSDQD